MWFDSNGCLLKDIPNDVVEACSHSGECFYDVEYWQKKLNFMADRKLMEKYLKEYGAWEDLKTVDDITLAQRCLWLACNDIKEQGEFLGLVH